MTRNQVISAVGHYLKEYAGLTILLFSFLILSIRLATFLHEAVGHALAAILFGGQCQYVYVGVWGGGYASCALREGAEVWRYFFFRFGGIITNLLSGTISILFCKTSKARVHLALFLAVFGLVSVLGAYAYLVVGVYYDVGDPAGWIPDGTLPAKLLPWLFLSLAPIIGYYTFLPYLRIQERVSPSAKQSKRLMKCAMTLGVSMSIYTFILFLTPEGFIVLDAPRISYDVSKSEIRRQKLEKIVETLENDPDILQDQLNRFVERVEIGVEPHEIPRRFPIIPPLGVLFLMGFMFSSRRTGERLSGNGRIRLSWEAILANMAIASSVVFVIWVLS